MAAARELFIYYRIALDDAPALQAQVLAFQQRLMADHPGLTARLLRRPEPADGWQTWMETYTMPARSDGVTEALQHEIERVAAQADERLRVTPRHVEVFVPCAC